MLKKTLMITLLTSVLASTAGLTLAADQNQERFKEKIYGSQFMTKEERTEYRNKILSAKTEKERENIRVKHRELIKERTKKYGLVIEDDIPERSGGMGSGMGVRRSFGGEQR